MNDMEKIDPCVARISLMEQHLDKASGAVQHLDAALDEMETAIEAITALDRYYGSNEWRQDLADDEAGRLPAGMKRGVLSEDAVWNLLADCREMANRMRALAVGLE